MRSTRQVEDIVSRRFSGMDGAKVRLLVRARLDHGWVNRRVKYAYKRLPAQGNVALCVCVCARARALPPSDSKSFAGRRRDSVHAARDPSRCSVRTRNGPPQPSHRPTAANVDSAPHSVMDLRVNHRRYFQIS